ncbi:MAG: cupin domain-containing protein [Nitrososphaeria archaeon]
MKIKIESLPKEEIQPGVYRKWVFDKNNGAIHFFLRVFEIEPGKGTTLDKHDYEHEIYILEGKGLFRVGEEEEVLEKNDAVLIPPNVPHFIRNFTDSILKFICVVPSTYRREG